MIELGEANGNGHPATVTVDFIFDLQHKISKRIKRRVQNETLGFLLGYQSGGAISGWTSGAIGSLKRRAQFRFTLLNDALDGKVGFPPGTDIAKPDAAIMAKWHDDAWANHVLKETEADKRIANAASAFSPRHIMKGLDQNGESLDRIERQLTALSDAVNGLLVEWRSTRGDG